MKVLILTILSSSIFGILGAATTVLTEGFENPVYDESDATPFYEIYTTGTYSFDASTPYQITTPGDSPGSTSGAPTLGISPADTTGTYPTSEGATTQVFGFGAGDNGGANSLEVTLNGFAGATGGEIAFEHFATGTDTQTALLTIVDTDNPASILLQETFSGTAVGASSVLRSFAAPSGDTITVNFTQTGNTFNSDFFLDNITVTSIPEASSSLLLAMSSMFALFRRKRLR
jgi:hypothetical protein